MHVPVDLHPLAAQVIVMTAFGPEATRQRAMGLEAHGFLSKPFRSQALLALLARDPFADSNL